MPHRVFVYGSLRKGQGNHGWLVRHKARLLGNAVYPRGHAKMVSLGAYPALVADLMGPDIHGEVYEVTRDGLRALDKLEGTPDFYRRVKVRVYQGAEELRVWTYVLAREAKNVETVTCGDWVWYLEAPMRPLLALIEQAKRAKDVSELPEPLPPTPPKWAQKPEAPVVVGSKAPRTIREVAVGKAADEELAALPDGEYLTVVGSKSRITYKRDKVGLTVVAYEERSAKLDQVQPLFTPEELKPAKSAKESAEVFLEEEERFCRWCGEELEDLDGFGWVTSADCGPVCIMSPNDIHEPETEEDEHAVAGK